MIDRLRLAFTSLVEQLTARFDYHASYPARVAAQNEDNTLELRPDDPRFGAGLSRVPIRGLPGVVCKVKKDARVLFTWEGGNPDHPIATLFTADGLERLEVTASVQVTVTAPLVILGKEEGSKRVACVGDPIQAAMPALMPVSGVIASGAVTGTLSGLPFVGTVDACPFTGFMNVIEPVLGVIDSTAQSRVQAG